MAAGKRVRGGVAVEPAVSRLRSGGGRVSSVRVAGVQRARILAAAMEIACELGYGAMSTARVSARAGVSRRTFYELFEDREDCFLAVFDEAVARATVVAQRAAPGREGWCERVRAGLFALLVFLDDEPGLGSLLVVGVLGTGPKVLERRARIIESLAAVVDGGRSEAAAGGGPPPPPLTGEGVVGAVLSVIHGRMLEDQGAPLTGLLNPLMGMIVLPYLGAVAAGKELRRPVPRVRRSARRESRSSVGQHPLKGLEVRPTYRTLRVVYAISELGEGRSNPNNREVAEHAGVIDQGQISKLLARLEHFGLVQNTGVGHAKGEPNAWVLTAKGRELAQSISTHDHREAA